MKIDDVVALAKAGFSADQITRMLSAAPDPEPAPAPEPDPALAPEPAPAPAPEDKRSSEYASLLEAINGLRGTIQKSNIGSSTQPERPSVDDILAEIINPPARH